MGKGIKAGKKSGGSQKNAMQKKIRQMQVMQEKIDEMHAELEQKEVTAASGGGAVKATVNGKKELVNIELKPEAVDPDDVEMLQDLIIAAVNEGLRQIEEMTASEMNKISGSFGLPGF
jgi:DNA-binding YbaB/EbfC family protein